VGTEIRYPIRRKWSRRASDAKAGLSKSRVEKKKRGGEGMGGGKVEEGLTKEKLGSLGVLGIVDQNEDTQSGMVPGE